MTAAVLENGFDDRPRQSAVAFRAALDALARPGQVREVTGAVPPAGLSVAAGVLLLTLTDAETRLWLPERLRNGPVAEWLRFHTNAPFVCGRGQAMFAVGFWDELMPLEDWPPNNWPPNNWPGGEPAYPDRSATLIVEVTALEGGPVLDLSGPGIDGAAQVAPVLPDDAAAALKANAARFPLGLDFFFTAGDRLIGLPRSTRIGPRIGG
jgi:alpha-D-ribose 1-methylphosphonate 5-triphosphate synthase subunit PhnH